MLFVIKRFNKKEFSIGMDVLKIIERATGLLLGEDEAGFIALHLVNARMDGSEMKSTIKMSEIVQNILNIVTYHYKVVLDIWMLKTTAIKVQNGDLLLTIIN